MASDLFADVQVELRKESEKLSFQSEYQLSKKPMEIDVLIIKKKTEEPIEKNIGRIFRKYNIVEYKSPTVIRPIFRRNFLNHPPVNTAAPLSGPGTES